jgi:glycosyltransferase involved in cell wall biosynthesis
MRVAFYAPLKAPDRGAPSGDRRLANSLIAALRVGGHDVSLMSRFRSREAAGDVQRQMRIRDLGGRLANRLIRRLSKLPAAMRPQIWFTYHLYYKAPDWLGPAVAHALDIPYVVAEASHAPKRDAEPWQMVHRAAESAIRSADAVLALNSDDVACLLPIVTARDKIHNVAPFIDVEQASPPASHVELRQSVADELGLDPKCTWLVCAAMMRPGDKLASYELLASALGSLRDSNWQLLVIGDGDARAQVETALKPYLAQVQFAGARAPHALPRLLGACDIYVWPAINEAFGIALLEAQAAGLPVVAGRTRGVPDVVTDGVTGYLAALGDSKAFAQAIDALMADADTRTEMARAGRLKVAQRHDTASAATTLNQVLSNLRGETQV